jgi:hypothetical protein
MPQRIDAGPVVAALGAVLLFLSLFLSWYEPDVSGWDAFESLDLILAAVAIAAGVRAAGQLGARIAQDAHARTLPLLGAIAVAAVGVTLLQAPPAAEGADLDTGAWLALGSSVLILVGGALSAAQISVTVTVAGREAQRRVPAVDRRRADETTAAEEDRERTASLDVDELLADDRGDEPPKPPPE